jgi:hypothetical protein
MWKVENRIINEILQHENIKFDAYRTAYVYIWKQVLCGDCVTQLMILTVWSKLMEEIV